MRPEHKLRDWPAAPEVDEALGVSRHQLGDTAPPRLHLGRKGPLLAVTLCLGAMIAVVATPQLRWRAHAVELVLAGEIPDMGLADLLSLIRPGAGQAQISRIIAARNPYAVIQVPALSGAQRAAGAHLYGAQCAGCHAPDGTGGAGAPALTRELAHGATPWALFRTIRDGVPGTGMPPHPLTRLQLWELVAYVSSLRVAVAVKSPTAVADQLASVDVPYETLAHTEYAAKDWLTYGGSYNSNRFSTLSAIDTHNVSQLALQWLYPFASDEWRIECSPLERNGILYVSGPAGEVMAIDASTGRMLWEHDHPFKLIGGGEGPLGQSRGVALLGRRVFAATWDSTLTALSAATGRVLWETRVGPYPGTYISAAPLAFGHLVVIGVGGPPGDGREYLSAYDVRTGELRWRFRTIPGPGRPGHDTWAGDSWKTGGAGAWMTGSYDPVHDILYWGIGNPRPDFDASGRVGDNLYSDSVVALRGSTGKLLWSFQFTPGDTHDWDAAQVPLLVDRSANGRVERRLLFANRNGFYYVLDRLTGGYLSAVPFVRENWARGLDARGRPILEPVSESVEGHEVFPSARGATNWWPPSYDPDLGLTFIPVLKQGMTFFPTAETLPIATTHMLSTAVRAVKGYTGKLVWEYREPERMGNPTVSGLLSTRGGLVFGAADGRVFALDARSGKPLWSLGTGGTTYAAPVTYSVAGRQFVAVITGRTLLAFALPAPGNSAGMKPAGGASHAQARSSRSESGPPR